MKAMCKCNSMRGIKKQKRKRDSSLCGASVLGVSGLLIGYLIFSNYKKPTNTTPPMHSANGGTAVRID